MCLEKPQFSVLYGTKSLSIASFLYISHPVIVKRWPPWSPWSSWSYDKILPVEFFQAFRPQEDHGCCTYSGTCISWRATDNMFVMFIDLMFYCCRHIRGVFCFNVLCLLVETCSIFIFWAINVRQLRRTIICVMRVLNFFKISAYKNMFYQHVIDYAVE